MGKQVALLLKVIILNAASKGSELATSERNKQFFTRLFDELWGELEFYVIWSEEVGEFVLKNRHKENRKERKE